MVSVGEVVRANVRAEVSGSVRVVGKRREGEGAGEVKSLHSSSL